MSRRRDALTGCGFFDVNHLHAWRKIVVECLRERCEPATSGRNDLKTLTPAEVSYRSAAESLSIVIATS